MFRLRLPTSMPYVIFSPMSTHSPMPVAQTISLPPQSRGVSTWFRSLALLTALAAFALVVLGGVVRVTGSGLGCPDWPLCHGGIFPPLQMEAVVEYSHRLVASMLVGPLVVALCAATWIFLRHNGWLLVLATLALALTLGQAILGGVTVENELPAGAVAAHLALGEALLGCLVFILVAAYAGPPSLGPTARTKSGRGAFPKLAVASALAVYGILLTGSYVTVSNATWACTDWPLCHGDVFPTQKLAAIHMAHRLATVLLGLFVMYVLHLGLRGGRQPMDVRLLSMAGAALLLAQVIVGALTIWLRFPEELRALHLALGTMVWAAMAGLAALSLAPRDQAAPEPAHA